MRELVHALSLSTTHLYVCDVIDRSLLRGRLSGYEIPEGVWRAPALKQAWVLGKSSLRDLDGAWGLLWEDRRSAWALLSGGDLEGSMGYFELGKRAQLFDRSRYALSFDLVDVEGYSFAYNPSGELRCWDMYKVAFALVETRFPSYEKNRLRWLLCCGGGVDGVDSRDVFYTSQLGCPMNATIEYGLEYV